MRILIEVIDAVCVEVAGAALNPMHFISLVE